MNLREHIRTSPDFPIPGIMFRDIPPLPADPGPLPGPTGARPSRGPRRRRVRLRRPPRHQKRGRQSVRGEQIHRQWDADRWAIMAHREQTRLPCIGRVRDQPERLRIDIE